MRMQLSRICLSDTTSRIYSEMLIKQQTMQFPRASCIIQSMTVTADALKYRGCCTSADADTPLLGVDGPL